MYRYPNRNIFVSSLVDLDGLLHSENKSPSSCSSSPFDSHMRDCSRHPTIEKANEQYHDEYLLCPPNMRRTPKIFPSPQLDLLLPPVQ